MATASSVSRSTRATGSEWNLLKRVLDGRRASMRFEIVEGLAAVDAAILRLACSRTKLRDQLRIWRPTSGAWHGGTDAAPRTDSRDIHLPSDVVRGSVAETPDTLLGLRLTPHVAPRRA